MALIGAGIVAIALNPHQNAEPQQAMLGLANLQEAKLRGASRVG